MLPVVAVTVTSEPAVVVTMSMSLSPPSTMLPLLVVITTALAVAFEVCTDPSVISPLFVPSDVSMTVPLPPLMIVPSAIRIWSSSFPFVLTRFAFTSTFPVPVAVTSPVAANRTLSSAWIEMSPAAVVTAAFTTTSLFGPMASNVMPVPALITPLIFTSIAFAFTIT